ncbi:hypothetical protein [Plantactinospora sp. KLBMP9567]|uniref:hypothetical protein n=1 Tax=Plantactinospora sp. KLBMP9567 TaxID=3085900 RepID=UPI00298162D1|nr:hypothetical protein [Plantactinospora sp. KLBMP9567]MDW5322876.1 hypothetical protein [Plantactinospora sp. KLBMP9567]
MSTEEIPTEIARIVEPSTEEKRATKALPIAKVVAGVLTKGTLSLVPGGGFVTELMHVVEQRSDRKKQEVLALAVAALQEDADALKARLEDDDELAALWLRGLSAAQVARTSEKLKVFAAILAGAVDADHHQRMVANALFRVLEQLEQEHIEVMRLVEEAGAAATSKEPDGSNGRSGATLPWLQERLPHLTPVLPLLLATLTSLSLTRNAWENTWGGIEGRVAFVLTDLGSELLRVFRSQV